MGIKEERRKLMVELGWLNCFSRVARGDFMHTKISVFIILNYYKFCVVNYSSNFMGYYVDIRNKKWGDKLVMGVNSFNKYLDGEPTDDSKKACVYGKLEPGKTSDEDHMWATDECSIADKYLTLCQELLCKCIDFAQK